MNTQSIPTAEVTYVAVELSATERKTMPIHGE